MIMRSLIAVLGSFYIPSRAGPTVFVSATAGSAQDWSAIIRGLSRCPK